jgi:hypothetical protein
MVTPLDEWASPPLKTIPPMTTWQARIILRVK